MFAERQFKPVEGEQQEILKSIQKFQSFPNHCLITEAQPHEKFYNHILKSGKRVTRILTALEREKFPTYKNRAAVYGVTARGEAWKRLIMDYSMKNLIKDRGPIGTNSRI